MDIYIIIYAPLEVCFLKQTSKVSMSQILIWELYIKVYRSIRGYYIELRYFIFMFHAAQ